MSDGGGSDKQGDICRDVVSDGPIEMDYGLAPSVSDKVAEEVSKLIRF